MRYSGNGHHRPLDLTPKLYNIEYRNGYPTAWQPKLSARNLLPGKDPVTGSPYLQPTRVCAIEKTTHLNQMNARHTGSRCHGLFDQVVRRGAHCSPFNPITAPSSLLLLLLPPPRGDGGGWAATPGGPASPARQSRPTQGAGP